jgi:hypothetical protein
MQEIEALPQVWRLFYLEHNGCFTGMSGSYWQRLFIRKSYRCLKNDTEIYTTFEGDIQYWCN